MVNLRVRYLLQIGISLGLVVLLLWWVDLDQVARLYRAADPLVLAAALLIAGADRLIMILKWMPLARVQGLPVPFGRAARVYLASNCASLFLPTSVGGDVVRAVAFGRPLGAVARVAASIAMERVLGLFGVGLVLAVAIPFALSGTAGLGQYAWMGAVGILTVLLLAALPFVPAVAGPLNPLVDRLRGRRVLGGMAHLWDAYAAYRSHPVLVVTVGLASALEQFVPVALYGLVAVALGIEVTFSALVVATIFAQLIGRLPVSVSGIGVEEGAAVLFLGLFGVAPSGALSLALGRRVLETLVFMTGALFWKELGTTPIRWQRDHSRGR